ncbi:hypothetical protein KM92DES2_11523 [uncultured Desulfovibrio sp.]|uniref:Uncharacterized protein n=1 Tax=uncultured Desulfovibrio sp. TaxID=167968 RepID=A0A212JQ21_9BACT|nr:hypothetical protein KM92DES2_11523 [uncultured Desulfovibrio sp.]
MIHNISYAASPSFLKVDNFPWGHAKTGRSVAVIRIMPSTLLPLRWHGIAAQQKRSGSATDLRCRFFDYRLL